MIMTNKRGEFGPVYTSFKGKPKEAITHLRRTRKGECINVFHREDIGYIDIAWGNDDYGLKHIIQNHEAEIKDLGYTIAEFISAVVELGTVIKKEERNQYKKKIMLDTRFGRVVITTRWLRSKKKTIITAFDLRRIENKNPNRILKNKGKTV